tara:strand:+ start:345 stop:1196 length:852 start_codon:yes stop_codon:yes gene_type:complete
MNYNITKHIIVLFISINIVIAQFINVETNIDLRQIRENDRFYFDNFREDVTNFFILNTFGTDLEYLELSSNVHIIIESIIDNNNQKIINAQVVITNRSDIMMTLKSFSFPINELKNISYNPNSFSPLNSLLEFIAQILIANEIDTYESKGGNEHYNIALSISQIGKESDYSKGWHERWRKCKQIQENFFLRDMKYYYFLSYEDWFNEDLESLKNNVDLLHNAIELNSNFIGIDNNTINFFKAFSKNIIQYYSTLNFKEKLSFLSEYDIDNKALYLRAIEQLEK